MTPSRYAIYVLPDPSEAWAAFCTAWLGWDLIASERVPHPDMPCLEEPLSALTTVPRRYGLHATIKPPFRLRTGKSPQALEKSLDDLAGRLSPVTVAGLEVTRLGRFLALTATGDLKDLNDMAATTVRDLDAFRAPPSAHELARRREAPLSPSHNAMLETWGYPYVMEHFRFHITLTGKLPKDTLSTTEAVLNTRLQPVLPRPYRIADLALVGEDEDGFFHLIKRAPLGG